MKQILIILGLFASVTTFAQSPRIKLNQITKDTVKGSVLISSPSDSGMVYSRDFYIAYGADTVLILYGDTLASTSGIISSVLSDGVTITGDGTTGNELKVDTSTVISTIQGLVDTLTNRGYLTANQTITLSGDVTGSGTTSITATVVDDSHDHIISNVDFLQDSLDAKANDSDLANYVTIAGADTITGAKTFTNTFTQSGGDANFDNNTLYVDESANKVGIGTSTPDAELSVVGNISLDSGNGNFVIGKNAGESLTSGSSNTAIGSNALQYTTTTNNNFAIGSKALQNNTIGYNNTAIGTNALRDNTEGANNFAIGTNALLFNQTASSNFAIGGSALQRLTYGSLNTAIGGTAGQFLANGSNYLDSVSNSVYVGYFTKASANNVTNENVFGYSATGNGSNSVTLGNSSITKTILNGNVGIGTSTPAQKLDVNGKVKIQDLTGTGGNAVYENGGVLGVASDARFKTYVGDIQNGIALINQLKPKYFIDNRNSSFQQLGFYAQEVKSVINEASYPIGNTDYLGINDRAILATTVKAIQEQQAQIETIQTELNAKSLIIETQATEIDQLKTLITDLTNRIQILENK